MDALRVIQYVNEVSELTLTFRSALVDARRQHKGADRLTVARLAELVAESPDVRDSWISSADFPRRDYMTFCAEQAFRAGVTEEMLWAEGDSPAIACAADLVGLAMEQIGKAVDPAASLLPDMPTAIASGPVVCYAVSTVCDSSEPEADKILTCALLNAAAELGNE